MIEMRVKWEIFWTKAKALIHKFAYFSSHLRVILFKDESHIERQRDQIHNFILLPLYMTFYHSKLIPSHLTVILFKDEGHIERQRDQINNLIHLPLYMTFFRLLSSDKGPTFRVENYGMRSELWNDSRMIGIMMNTLIYWFEMMKWL